MDDQEHPGFQSRVSDAPMPPRRNALQLPSPPDPVDGAGQADMEQQINSVVSALPAGCGLTPTLGPSQITSNSNSNSNSFDPSASSTNECNDTSLFVSTLKSAIRGIDSSLLSLRGADLENGNDEEAKEEELFDRGFRLAGRE